MIRLPSAAKKFPSVAAFSVLLAGTLVANVAQSATVFYQTGVSGGGQQVAYATSTPISGTMTAPVPRFNGGLGTLLQADYEFAGSATGTWSTNIVNQTGNSTLSLSGPADVSGQPMGNIALGFSGAYSNPTGSNDFSANSAFLTLTSGGFFNTLTGVGTYPMNWIYSGNTTLDTPGFGTSGGGQGFSWGGSVHVTYTYEPVPEPSTFILGGIGLLGFLAAARKRRSVARGLANFTARLTQRSHARMHDVNYEPGSVPSSTLRETRN